MTRKWHLGNVFFSAPTRNRCFTFLLTKGAPPEIPFHGGDRPPQFLHIALRQTVELDIVVRVEEPGPESAGLARRGRAADFPVVADEVGGIVAEDSALNDRRQPGRGWKAANSIGEISDLQAVNNILIDQRRPRARQPENEQLRPHRPIVARQQQPLDHAGIGADREQMSCVLPGSGGDGGSAAHTAIPLVSRPHGAVLQSPGILAVPPVIGISTKGYIRQRLNITSSVPQCPSRHLEEGTSYRF